MKKIRIKKAYTGPRGTFPAGTEMNMDDAEAASWLRERMGEEVGAEKVKAKTPPTPPQAVGKETATEKPEAKREKAVE